MNAHSESAPPARNEDSVFLHMISFAAVGLAIAALGLGVESRWLLLVLVMIAAEGYLLSLLLRRSNSPIWLVGPFVPVGGIILLLTLAFEETLDENRLLVAILSLAISGFLAVSRRSLYSSLLLSGLGLAIAARHHDEAVILTGIYVVLVLAFLARATSIDATRGTAGQTNWRRQSRAMTLVVYCGVIAVLGAAFFWVLPWEGEQADASAASIAADVAASSSGPPSQLITPAAELSPGPAPEAQEAQAESGVDKSVDTPPPQDALEAEQSRTGPEQNPASTRGEGDNAPVVQPSLSQPSPFEEVVSKPADGDPASTQVQDLEARTEPSATAPGGPSGSSLPADRGAGLPQGGEAAAVQVGTPVSPIGGGSWRAGDYIREGLSDTVGADGFDARLVAIAGGLIAVAVAAALLVWRRRSTPGQHGPDTGEPADKERLEIVDVYRRLEAHLSKGGFAARGQSETPARYLARVASQLPEAVGEDLRDLAAAVSQAAYGPAPPLADAAVEARRITLRVESSLRPPLSE